jgi:mono/diheme cytochrome c family protein
MARRSHSSWRGNSWRGNSSIFGLVFAAIPLALVVAVMAPVVRGAPTADQKAKIAAVGRDVNAAEKLFKEKKHRDAADLVAKSVAAVGELLASGDKDVIRTMDLFKKRLELLHTELSLQGIALPPLKFDAPAKPTDSTTPTAVGKVSFVKQVAPMLVGKCGKCHVDDSKGKFSMRTFAALQKGAAGAGIVVMPKNSKGSRIIEVIESGDMPRGGAKVARDELATLARWIDEGAAFDGPSRTAPLRQLVGNAAATKMDEPMLQVVRATGKETISYARDVAPVFAGTCVNCHGEQNPRANFSVANFERFLRGGDGGRAIVPGKPEESLLVRKLKGTAGDRMPLRLPPLSAEVIGKIEKWIAEGAKFDGGGPRVETAQVVALYTAQHATHEELSASRAKLARGNWKLVVPDDQIKPAVLETENFLLYGNVTDARLKEVADAAQKQMAKIASTLKLPTDRPPVKGRVTVFVFNQRYDYSEFGQMVEKRQLPNVWLGHWGYTVIDAYACVIAPRGNEFSLDSLLAQQLAGVVVASQGPGVPRWFAEGSGRAVVSSFDTREKRFKQWDAMIGGVLAGSTMPEAFITGGLPPEEADIAAYGFAKELKPTSLSYIKLLGQLRGGSEFERAFAAVYKATPLQMAQAWARRNVRRG